VEAAGVVLPPTSNSLIIQQHRSAQPARNARRPWSRYKTGTVSRRRQTAPAPMCGKGGLEPPRYCYRQPLKLKPVMADQSRRRKIGVDFPSPLSIEVGWSPPRPTVLTCSPGGTPASVTVVVADASSRMIDGKIGRNARLEFMIFVLRRRALFADPTSPGRPSSH